MRQQPHYLELLSPARDAAIAREAILHGADAVYIGGPGFGARHNASNSLRDIADLVPFAHRYNNAHVVAGCGSGYQSVYSRCQSCRTSVRKSSGPG